MGRDERARAIAKGVKVGGKGGPRRGGGKDKEDKEQSRGEEKGKEGIETHSRGASAAFANGEHLGLAMKGLFCDAYIVLNAVHSVP